MLVFSLFIMFCGEIILFNDLDILWLFLLIVKLWVSICLYGVWLLIVIDVIIDDIN